MLPLPYPLLFSWFLENLFLSENFNNYTPEITLLQSNDLIHTNQNKGKKEASSVTSSKSLRMWATVMPPFFRVPFPPRNCPELLFLRLHRMLYKLRISAARVVAKSKYCQVVRNNSTHPSDQWVGNSGILPKCLCIYKYSRLRKPHLYFLAA